MELRVAQAHWNARPYQGDWGNLSAAERNLQIEQTRAAIRAMREPTKDMFAATEGECGYVTEDAWRAMIDAASPPD